MLITQPQTLVREWLVWYYHTMPLEFTDRIRTQWRELPQESRFAIGILCMVGFGVLGFSAAYLRLRVTGPFFVPLATIRESANLYDDLLTQNNQDLELRKKDTDRDGLNDYSELKVYKTSPYLADSDSDGFADAIEIAQGTDPNCPKGQQCIQGLNNDRVTGEANSDLLEADNPVEAFILQAPDPTLISSEQKRQYLVETGYVTANELSDLPNAQIDDIYLSAFGEAVKIRQQLQEAASASSTTSTVPVIPVSTTTNP